MKQKKTKKLLIILIILVIVLIILLGFAYLYFSTDILKSNKQLFFKYAGQVGNVNNGFIDSKLREYFNNKKIFTNENEGSISVNISSDKEKYENVNNMNVTFSGVVNNSNLYNRQEINLNYSGSVKFPLIYMQDKNKIGIQTDYIGSKYIVVDTDDFESVFEENSENVNKIQNFIEVQNSQSNISEILEKYMYILSENLSDTSFSKIEESETEGYKVNLSGQELKNIAVKLLEVLKQDTDTLERIYKYIKIQEESNEITTSDIDNAIKDINENTRIEEENLEIIIYQAQGKINRINIKISQGEILLEKVTNNNELQYNVKIRNDKNIDITFIAKFTNIDSKQNINESYELILENEELEWELNYNNNINLVENINFESFNSDNSIILNDMDKEKRKTLISAITERIQLINKQQMEKLKLKENENPISQAFVPVLGLTNYSQASDTINNSTNSVEETAVATFNSKFEVYKSTNLQGTTVKGLLSTIVLSNESQEEDRQIQEIHLNGEEFEATEQTISSLKSEIELESYYRVEFEMDEETGLIYRVVINKK